MITVSSAEKEQYLRDIVNDPDVRGKRNARGRKEHKNPGEITQEDLWRIQAAEIKGRAAATLLGDGDKGGGASGTLNVLETQQRAMANKLAAESNDIQKFQTACSLVGKDVVVRELGQHSGKFEAETGSVDFVVPANDKKKEVRVSVNGKLYPLSAIRGLGDVEKAVAAKKDGFYTGKVKAMDAVLKDAQSTLAELRDLKGNGSWAAVENSSVVRLQAARSKSKLTKDAGALLNELQKAADDARAACEQLPPGASAAEKDKAFANLAAVQRALVAGREKKAQFGNVVFEIDAVLR
jgi:hypothetical protein